MRRLVIRAAPAPLLAVDTSGPWCAAYARAADGRSALVADARAKGHDAALARFALQAMAEVGLAPGDLARVAACVGPGGFTGVRIAVAFARGLAAGLTIPAVGVTSLRAWARRADPAGAGRVAAVHDAKRGEVCWAFFEAGAPVTEPRTASAAAAEADLAAWTGGADATLIGTGAALLAGPGRAVLDDVRVDLAALADLAAAADPAEAPCVPFYVRAPDATPAAAR